MDRFIHTTLSGLQGLLAAQRVAAGNIANASTPGFSRDLDLLTTGPGDGARIQTDDSDGGIDSTAGPVVHTGNPLDIAPLGNAMLAVADAQGRESYTKRGDLRPDSTGRLVTGDGRYALGSSGPVQLPPGISDVTVSNDGTLSFRPVGGSVSDRTTLDRLKLVTPAPRALRRGGDGALLSPGAPLPADMSARLAPGHILGSNVNAVGEMVGILERARAFEVQVKLLAAARELDSGGASLMRLDQ